MQFVGKLRKIGLQIFSNKVFLSITMIIWLLVSYSMFLGSNEEWKSATERPQYVQQLEYGKDTITRKIILNDGETITQSVAAECTQIEGVSFFCYRNPNVKNGTVTIEILDESGKQITVLDMDIQDIPTTEGTSLLCDFQFDKAVSLNAKQQYIIKISTRGVETGTFGLEVAEIQNEENMTDALIYKFFCGNNEFLKPFLLVLYLGMTGAILIAFFTGIKNCKLEWVFVMLVLVVGILYMLLLPPYSVPDEPAHFATVYSYSGKMLGENVTDEEGRIVVEDELLWGAGETSPNTRSYGKYLTGLLGGNLETGESDVSTIQALPVSSTAYFPQVIGVSIARILEFNSVQILYCGRFFALLWYIAIMFCAIKLIPFGKMALFVIGALPMTIQMVISYNYDSVLFGVCFFVFAYLINLIQVRERVTWKDIVVLALSGIIISQIKFIYLTILALAFLIPKEKFGTLRKKILASSVTMGICGVVIIVSRFATLQRAAGGHLTNAANPVEAMSLGFILKHPVAVFNVLFRTLEHELSYYLSGMVASPLGWLELYLPDIVVFGFIILIGLSIVGETQKPPKIALSLRTCSLLACFATALLGMVAMLCDCTPVNAITVWGYQGRYLLPVLPFAIVLLQNKVIVFQKNINRYLVLFLSYLHCAVIFYISLNIIAR